MKTDIQTVEQLIVTANDKKKEYKGFAKKINSSLETSEGAIKVLNSSDSVAEVAQPVEVASTLNRDEISSLIKDAITSVTNSLQETQNKLNQVESKLISTQETLTETETKLNSSEEKIKDLEKDSKILSDLGKLNGSSITPEKQPMQPMEVLGEGSPEMRAFEKLFNSSPKKVVESSVGYSEQRDDRQALYYWKNNKEKISQGVEAILRDKGFLSGGRITNAITSIGDIPSVAFTHLSNYIRENRYADLIHWQFANQNIVDSVSPGLNTAVPRYPYFARPTTIASRQLSELTPINGGSQNVQQINTQITIEELGLGKDANNLPVGLSSFVSAFSMADLEQIIMNNLGMDYQAYNDLRLWSLWFGTDTIVYPSFTGTVVTNPTNLTANDGIFNKDYFINLRALMKIRQIKPYSNGCYGFTFNPGGFSQFLMSLSNSERYINRDDENLVSRVLQQAGSADNQGVVSGYRMTWNGFMMFEQNIYGVGATPGTDPGVSSITVGSTPTIFDTNFAFGSNTIAKATALSVEMRQSEIIDYSRKKNFIWYSHEGYGALDVKDDVVTGSELRVIQVRNKRV